MDNVLVDERRIHVDFSQSVAKQWNRWRRNGKFDNKVDSTTQYLDDLDKSENPEWAGPSKVKYENKFSKRLQQRGGFKNTTSFNNRFSNKFNKRESAPKREYKESKRDFKEYSYSVPKKYR